MGISLHLNWGFSGNEKYLYIAKLSCYPSKLWYSNSEIPDQDCPSELQVKYLPKYLEWFSHLKFLIEKLPDAYMQLDTCTATVDEIKDWINTDIKSIQNAIKKAAELKRAKQPVWLSVG